MGIRLDWEIEADNQHIDSRGEDPEAVRKRRAARFRLILTLIIAVAISAIVIAFVFIRLEEAEQQIETLLTDTVQAEVAALRIGDWTAFSEVQRSASTDWLVDQRQLFEQYQTLLAQSENAQLTGQVLDVDVDDPRGRVQVQEIIDGVPYTRTWFYWRFQPEYDEDGEETFEGGWRHVPPDYTYWGEPRTYEAEPVTVDYFALDEPFATAVGENLQQWVAVGCAALSCVQVPQVEVQIRPGGVSEMVWGGGDTWVMRVPSPYVNRARSDMPFTPELQIEAATLLAERMVAANGGGATFPADAYFIQQEIVSWLVGQFVVIDTGTHLINSLAANYEPGAIGQVLTTMQPSDGISVLSSVTGATLDQSNLDWRGFFTWRLQLENQFIQQQNSENFLVLYNTRDEAVFNLASARFGQAAPEGQPMVTSVQPAQPSAGGQPQLSATVNYIAGEQVIREEQVIFRLVDNVWLRAS